jgi:hypothetical protein
MEAGHLRIFLDRSVGTKRIAIAMREMGLDVESIRDRYGDEASIVADARWIEDATRDGRVLIGADQRIRYNRLERLALCRFNARCFTFPRGDFSAEQMVERIETHLMAMIRQASQPGSYVYHLARTRMEPMKLDCADLEM